MDIKAPHYNKCAIKNKAEEFISEYNPSRNFPLEIELIAENQNIKIYPIPELKKRATVDGFIKPDLSQIAIDEDIYFNCEVRARFTIAHEMGHWYLHKDLYNTICKNYQYDSETEYLEFISKIPQKELGFVEWQSFFFAANILVPPKELNKQFNSMLNGSTVNNLTADVLMSIVEELCAFFKVSSQVIQKRLIEENTIPNKILEKNSYL